MLYAIVWQFRGNVVRLLAKTAQLSIERQHVGELTEECRRHQSNIQCLELRCRKQSRRLTILQQVGLWSHFAVLPIQTWIALDSL